MWLGLLREASLYIPPLGCFGLSLDVVICGHYVIVNQWQKALYRDKYHF
jgi:hypothetical protein